MSGIKDSVRIKKILYIYMAIMFVIKVWTISGGNISVIAYARVDDRLMVDQAYSLLNGEWLGSYNETTLVKGMVFPAFLAICNFLSIPYLSGITIFYGISVIIFMKSIKKLIPNQFLYGLVYTLLLFNPITMSTVALQRVYRNSLTPGQVLLVLACIFGLYTNKNEKFKKLFPWSLGLGLSVWAIWNTREDGIWIIPILVVSTLITLISIINEKNSNVRWKKNMIIVILPFLIFFVGNITISSINYYNYKIFTTNELNGKAFTGMMKSIYSVKPEKAIDFVAVPRDTIKKIYTVSPTLNSISEELEILLDAWEVEGKIRGDMEVENGWFFWCLRDAMAMAGYFENPSRASDFCENVAEEISVAAQSNSFEQRKAMPSALMVPWEQQYFSKMGEELLSALKYIVYYKEIYYGEVLSYEHGTNGIRLFESLTNNIASTTGEKILELKGWIFSKDVTDNLEIAVVDNAGKNIRSLITQPSPDVFESFSEYESSKNARFSTNIDINKSYSLPLKLKVTHQSGKQEEIVLGENRSENESTLVWFDSNEIKDAEDDMRTDVSKMKESIINGIIKVYKIINVPLLLLSLLIYGVITFIFLKNIRKKENPVIAEWLFLSSILGSFLILCIGVVYTEVSSYFAVNPLYLSGIYSLMIGFEGICLISMKKIFDIKKELNSE